MNKTLLAAAVASLFAGVAQADIIATTDATDQALLQVYDKTQGVTFDYNLGVTGSSLAAGDKAGYTFDLSTEANWAAFQAYEKAGDNIIWAVVANAGATNPEFTSVNTYLVTTGTGLGKHNGLTVTSGPALSAMAQGIQQMQNNANPFGNSKLVLDTQAAGTGQWSTVASGANTPDNIDGTFTYAKGAVAYGNTASFYEESTTFTTIAKLGSFSLSGPTLTYVASNYAPAAVPVPAAVWLFGTGLMGFLGLSRRKAA